MTETRPEDVALATAILEHYCGPVADLGQDKFLCFTNMTTDSFFWVGGNMQTCRRCLMFRMNREDNPWRNNQLAAFPLKNVNETALPIPNIVKHCLHV